MNKRQQLKEALKVEIRKVLNENEYPYPGTQKYKLELGHILSNLIKINDAIEQDGPIDENIQDAIESIEKALNSKIEENDINELARVASVIKIGNLKAAEAYRDANKGKWVSDMVDKVIQAGEAGITQVDLAQVLGKGGQQAINPKVREMLAAGVFVQGGGNPEQAIDKGIPEKPKEKTKPDKSAKKEEPDEDDEVDFEDDYEKSEDEDSEDEEDLARKATPNKKLSSTASQFDSVTKKMKALAKDYAEAKKEGNKEKEKEITLQLKDLNKEKSKLEKLINKDLGDDEDED